MSTALDYTDRLIGDIRSLLNKLEDYITEVDGEAFGRGFTEGEEAGYKAGKEDASE